MKKVIVGRHTSVAVADEEMELIMDEEGCVKVFDSKADVFKFLAEKGLNEEELEKLTILESCGTCFRCGSPLFPSFIEGYKYQCFTCDEDFYGFEQENRRTGKEEHDENGAI